jgi:hypothetical protein
MMFQRYSLNYHRCVLICLLAVMWISPAAAVAAGPTNRLQALLDDTAAQIQLAYRQQPDERERRQAELVAVVAAWRIADRNETNNIVLATWLRAAIFNSMPGSREPLPKAPKFVATAKSVVQRARSTAAKEASASSDAKSADDPFRDDPKIDRE